MLDEYIETANNTNDFIKHAGVYFANMEKNIRTLHKTGYRSCQYSSFAYQFIPFNSFEEVVAFENKHTDMTPFRRCGNCFRKQR